MNLRWMAVLVISMILQGVPAEGLMGQVLSSEAFINDVKRFHPVAKQAALQVRIAEAQVMSAKGSFDPTIAGEASRKKFTGTDYYQYNSTELAVPLPIGNIKTGLEFNGGGRLNPEQTNGRFSYVGVELPVGRNILTDARRTALLQAKIYQSQSEQERLQQVNDLLYDAYAAYWQWAGSWRQYNAMKNFVEVAEKRLRLVRLAYTAGDRALMDTVEAHAQFLQYKMMLAAAQLERRNAELELNNFLWQSNEQPAALPATAVPEETESEAGNGLPAIQLLLDQAAVSNPGIRITDFKIRSLEAEQRLKRQNLLPYFTAKANLLSKNYYTMKTFDAGYFNNNYNYGIDLKIPLPSRYARGEYRSAQLKVRQTQLALAEKRVQLTNKIRSYYNEYITVSEQAKIVEEVYQNFQSLLRNEELKFSQGGSSLFLVNSRESKLIETLQKRIELAVKLNKARYAVQWAAGSLR